MSQNLPEPINLQSNSVPLDSLDAGTTTNDVVKWNRTAWISTMSCNLTLGLVDTTNQVNINIVGDTACIPKFYFDNARYISC